LKDFLSVKKRENFDILLLYYFCKSGERHERNMLQHPVPDQHLKSIGDITVSFALLESQIQSLIGSLLNERQRIGQIITAELPFKNLIALMISLYIERHGKEDADFKKLKGLMTHARQVEDKRNQITHSIWGANKDADTITRIKTRAKEKHGIRFYFEDTSSDCLADFATEIKVLTEEIQRFWIDLMKNGKAINDHTRQ